MLVFMVLVVLLISLGLWYGLEKVYSRFSRYGVKTAKPLPVLGNAFDGLIKKKYVAEELRDLYSRFPEERFIGRYIFMRPVLVVRDIELIKKITIKDFKYFHDHTPLVDEVIEPLLGRNLVSLKGKEWRHMRSVLSPAFTSSKMRIMVPFMAEINKLMVDSLKRRIDASGVDYIDLDCKDMTNRCTNDIVACCVLGMNVDSHTEVDNQFYALGRKISTFGLRQKLIFLIYTAFPMIMKKFQIKVFTEISTNLFRSIILATMKERQDKQIVRPDLLHLLKQAKKDWPEDDVMAQAYSFFVGGSEIVSSALSFLLYELARNPDIQDRLVQEIREQHAKNNSKFDLSALQDLKYLDMVVLELLRLWPPVAGLDRICMADYNIGRPNDKAKDFILRKGEAVMIPSWGFHYNPEYFPNPHKFDPERFSVENKYKIRPFTYMPFGLGPRNCIGAKFAMCEIKVMAYQLLLHMEVLPCEKTPVQAKLCASSITMQLASGHWLRFKIRK